MIILEKFYKLLRPLYRYIFFVLEIMGWVVVLYFLTPILISIFQVQFPKMNVSFSDFVLLITAAFILAYTYETKKIRQETIFQYKMSYAVDVKFIMISKYKSEHLDKVVFGQVFSPEGVNNISNFYFISGIMTTPIGRCGVPFEISYPASKFLKANYFIESENGRDDFLRALKIQQGKIRARVLMTNGTIFIYTFKAMGENWEKTLNGADNLYDNFILVKKELDDI